MTRKKYKKRKPKIKAKTSTTKPFVVRWIEVHEVKLFETTPKAAKKRVKFAKTIVSAPETLVESRSYSARKGK